MTAKKRLNVVERFFTGRNDQAKQEAIDWIEYLHSELMASGWECLTEHSELDPIQTTELDQSDPSYFIYVNIRTRKYRINYRFSDELPIFLEVTYQVSNYNPDNSSSGGAFGITTRVRVSNILDYSTGQLINPTPWCYNGTSSSTYYFRNYAGPLSITSTTTVRNDLNNSGQFFFFETTNFLFRNYYQLHISPFSLFIQLDLDDLGNPTRTGYSVVLNQTTISASSTGHSKPEAQMYRFSAEGMTTITGYGARVGPMVSSRIGGVSIVQPMYIFQPHTSRIPDAFTYYMDDLSPTSIHNIEYSPGKSKEFIAIPELSLNISSNFNTRARLLLAWDGEEY